jgi:hypothetical protein
LDEFEGEFRFGHFADDRGNQIGVFGGSTGGASPELTTTTIVLAVDAVQVRAGEERIENVPVVDFAFQPVEDPVPQLRNFADGWSHKHLLKNDKILTQAPHNNSPSSEENLFFHTIRTKNSDLIHKSTFTTSYSGGKLCGQNNSLYHLWIKPHNFKCVFFLIEA